MKVLVACDTRPISNFLGYRVTSNGLVQSVWRKGTKVWSDAWNTLSPSTDAKGYLGLTICNEFGKRTVRIHRLVAESFLENQNNLPCVRHLDGNKKNNCVSNLAWGSYVENENDKKNHGTWNARIGGAKLSNDMRELAILRFTQGETHKSIADYFGVSRPTISRLVNGKTWRSVCV
jgi:hypothetical protein